MLGLTLSACASSEKPATQWTTGIVAAADPRAVAAGTEILGKGGSATDAAIATMLVLGLVEPQSAGLGGGGFLLHYDAETRDVDAFDGRERAPTSATAALFLNEKGEPFSFPEAVASGRSIGTPALVPMLKLAHDQHGKLPWKALFAPAIRLADEGFVVSPRLAQSLASVTRWKALAQDPFARGYFYDAAGAPVAAGTLLKNPAYAATLRAIRDRGPAALQSGPIAEAIIAAVQRAPRPGVLTLQDLSGYAPRELEPVCGAYRRFRVCGMPPPSSGGVAVLSILGLYERARPDPEGARNVDDWHAFLWASRIAYADRDHYVADDQYVPVPTAALVDPRYLDHRARGIAPGAAPVALQPGDPSVVVPGPSFFKTWGRAITKDTPGTTHLTVVDRNGDAVSMTATVEGGFGSQRMAGGFILNNQLTDFSLRPELHGLPVANAPEGGKRPRSSMAPTILLEPDGSFYGAIGSPGGSSIIAYVAKAVIGAVDWGLPLDEAVALPNLVARGPVVQGETGDLPEGVEAALAARGWKFSPPRMEQSGLHGVRRTEGGWEGAADPRREGAVGVAAH
jgi:gamma-glutamyltranspeptidase/glutathione hydrolase